MAMNGGKGRVGGDNLYGHIIDDVFGEMTINDCCMQSLKSLPSTQKPPSPP